MVSIGTSIFSPKISLSDGIKLALQKHFGVKLNNSEHNMTPLNDYIKEEGLYDGNFEYLTESEAREYLTSKDLDGARKKIDEAKAILNAKTVDEARNRRAEARQERMPQALDRTLPGSGIETDNIELTQGRPNEDGLDNLEADTDA